MLVLSGKKAFLIKDNVDKVIYHMREIYPTGYDFHHIPTADSNNGGVGLLGKILMDVLVKLPPPG